MDIDKQYVGSVNGFNVFFVDGDKLMKHVRWLKYFNGGHNGSLRFIPSNEIWIRQLGKDMDVADVEYILNHELLEKKATALGGIKQWKEAHKLVELVEHNPFNKGQIVEKATSMGFEKDKASEFMEYVQKLLVRKEVTLWIVEIMKHWGKAIEQQ